MGPVQRLVADPRRQQSPGGELGLRCPGHVGRELRDLRVGGVAEAALAPDPHHRQPVGDQRGRAPAPHDDGRMVRPAVVGQLEGPQDLQRLHPLLAQPRGVQEPGALLEVGHREEGLHRRPSSSTPGTARPTSGSGPARRRTSSGSTSPSGASTRTSAFASPRVGPTLTIATGMPSLAARSTNR